MSFYPQISFYQDILNSEEEKQEQVTSILKKAKHLEFISLEEIEILIKNSGNSEIRNYIFDTAKYITEKVFGNRIVIFAPLYYSNFCRNDCT